MSINCPKCNSTQQPDAWICTSCGFNIGLWKRERGEQMPAVDQLTKGSSGGGSWSETGFSSAGRDRGHYDAPRVGATPPRRTGGGPRLERPVPTRVHSYMWEAVFVTVICCNPIGILGIINAARATGLAQAGDGHGAQRAADAARNCVAIAVIISIAWTVYRWMNFDGGT